MSTDTAKPISAYESVRIDKELAEIPIIISKHEHYFYSKDQLSELHDMHDEINQVFEHIFIRNENKEP